MPAVWHFSSNASKTLLWEEVSLQFDPTKERIKEQNYQVDLAIQKLKRCL